MKGADGVPAGPQGSLQFQPWGAPTERHLGLYLPLLLLREKQQISALVKPQSFRASRWGHRQTQGAFLDQSGAQTLGYDTIVTFLLLFTNKKSFQSISFSLQGKQGHGEGHPSPPHQGASPHLLHECLDLVLQVLGQLWASLRRGHTQEAATVDGTQLPLHLPTCLEQPGHRGTRVSQQEGPR